VFIPEKKTYDLFNYNQMNLKESSIKITVILYLIIVAFILYFKPEMFYVNNNSDSKKYKTFGTGSRSNKTIFPIWYALIIIAIVIYFLVCLIVNKISK